MKHNNDKTPTAGKKAVRVAAAAALLVSIAFGSMFGSVDDIRSNPEKLNYSPNPIVMDIGDFGDATLNDDDDDATAEKTKGTVMQRFKAWISGLPLWARTVFVVPLWAVGTLLNTLISFLWGIVVTGPVGKILLTTILGFAILTGVFAGTAKLLFPDVPLRQILCKRNLIILIVMSVLLAAADVIIPIYWEPYRGIAGAVRLIASLALAGVLVSVIKRRLKNIAASITGQPA